MKIDIFPHILPKKYIDALFKEIGPGVLDDQFSQVLYSITTLWDIDCRFRIMDRFDDLLQVLTLGMPSIPLPKIVGPQKATDLAKLANDEMAELVAKYPDRFAAAVAALPMSSIDVALNEIDRAINDLKFRGIQMYTPTDDKPLDSPEFMPIYQKMHQYNLPIWIHPERAVDYPDYRTEKTSKYNIHATLGWPYETSAAMMRLVLSGILEEYPGLKFITHHAGAMIPFLEKRIIGFTDGKDVPIGRGKPILRRPTIEYFKMFYADTAIYGNTAGLMDSYAFFGAGHLLFGSDMPWDNQLGLKYTGETIESIERMDISGAEKKMIFEDNARSLLRLAV